jgi:hypothetical protein
MSQLQKTKRQANLKDFKRFGAFKGFVEQKKRCIQLVLVQFGFFFGTRVLSKLSFHSSFKLVHSCQKKPKLHTNSLNKLLFCSHVKMPKFTFSYLLLMAEGLALFLRKNS